MRRFTGDTLLVATHNPGKLEEIADLMSRFDLRVVSARDHDLPEPEETGTSFVENARIKAHAAAQATGLPALADDSGLEIDALDGAPGVYTADWAETSNGRDFTLAMTRAHDALIARDAPQPWTGRFCCTLVLAWPDGEDAVFEGRMEGKLIWPPRGEQGHGYDPMFQPEGHDVTFAQMDRWAKNRISHRGRAFDRLVTIFE